MANAVNFSNTTPSAPAGNTNVTFQNDSSSPPNISAYVPTSPLRVMPISSVSATWLGVTAYPATATVTAGAGRVLHARLVCNRSATGVQNGLLWCASTTSGYQTWHEGNTNIETDYMVSGSQVYGPYTTLTDTAGVEMFDIYMVILSTSNLSIGGWYRSNWNAGVTVFPNITNDSKVNMTGAITFAVVTPAFANIGSVTYEVL